MTSSSTSAVSDNGDGDNNNHQQPRRRYHHRYPHRGINNVHGTSCHTSSALQLLFHCFPEVTEALLQLAPVSAEYYWTTTATAAAADAAQRERRNRQRHQSREENNSDEASPVLAVPATSSVVVFLPHHEFVYQLSWFYHLLAYSEDVLQIYKEKVNSRQPKEEIAELATREKIQKTRSRKKKKSSTNSSNNSNTRETNASSSTTRMSAFQRATIKDFKAKSRAKQLSMDDWELLVMAMKNDTNQTIQYSVAAASTLDRGLIRPAEGVREGDEATQTNNEAVNSSIPTTHNSSIDPTSFYQYLSSYDTSFSPPPLPDNNKATTSNPNRRNSALAINTNNVGDAAMVFRCLVSSLEMSVRNELSRLQGVREDSHSKPTTQYDMMEQSETNEETETVVGGSLKSDDVENRSCNIGDDSGPSEQHLLSLLERVQLAMRHTWSGTLVSRIVGTLTSNTITTATIGTSTSSSSIDITDEVESNQPPSPTITTTTTKILQRTKRNGNIERPLPIPFPLPVINRQDKKSGGRAEDSTTHCYFQNIEQALCSVTIEPSPIRGYDWSELLQRGEVIEEQYETRIERIGETRTMDVTSSEVREKDVGVEQEEQETPLTVANDEVKDLDACAETAGEDANPEIRSIACQTDFHGYDMSTQTTYTDDTMPMKVDSSNQQQQDGTDEVCEGIEEQVDTTALPAAKFGVEKSACYAAAVAALVSSNQGTSVASRHSRVRRPALNRIDAAKNPGGLRETDMSVGSDGMENGTLSGIEIGNLSERDVHQDDTAMPRVISPMESLYENAKLSPDGSSSEEESSLDSHVSSVDTDTTSEENAEDKDDESFSTRSSAIETPSDIDNLSLGSFTDSEAESDEKKNNDVEVLHAVTHEKATCDGESLETNNEDGKQYQNGREVGQQSESCNSSVDIDDSVLIADGSGVGVSRVKDEKENRKETEMDPSTTPITAIIDFDTEDDTGAIRCNADDSTSSTTTTTSSASSTSTSSYSSIDDTSSTDSSCPTSSSSSVDDDDDNDDSDEIDNPRQDKSTGWITRKETRLRHPLPQSLIFHLKRFEYSAATGRVEKLAVAVDVPPKLNVRAFCSDLTPSISAQHDTTNTLETKDSCCYTYFLSGAIVHVDQKEMEDEIEFGRVTEGHYVTFLRPLSSRVSATSGNDPNHDEREEGIGAWTEIDDEMIRVVDSESDSTLDVLSGCDTYNKSAVAPSSKSYQKECSRYAMLLVYSRTCQCRD